MSLSSRSFEFTVTKLNLRSLPQAYISFLKHQSVETLFNDAQEFLFAHVT